MSTTIAVKKEVTSRTIRLHLSSREISDRLLIGEHAVMLKQIVHHTLAVDEGGDGSLAICEVITLLIFA
jgi:hypothetical protein